MNIVVNKHILKLPIIYIFCFYINWIFNNVYILNNIKLIKIIL